MFLYDAAPDRPTPPRAPLVLPPVRHDGWRWWLDPATDAPNIWHGWAGWIANNAPKACGFAGWRWWVWYGHIRLIDELERGLRGAFLIQEEGDG